MVKFIKPLGIAIGVLFFCLASLTVYALVSGRNLLLSQIEKNLGVKARASRISIGLPFSLVVNDLKVGDQISCARLTVTPSLLGLLNGGAVFNAIEVYEPAVRIRRHRDGTMDFGLTPPGKKEAAAGGVPATRGRKTKREYFYAEQIRILNGRVEFIDEGVQTAAPFKALLVDAWVVARRVSLFEPTRMRFDAEGRMSTAGIETAGRLSASGWVDPLAKDMDARVRFDDVDMTAFKAYYLKFLKKELTSGRMALAADLKSVANDLTVTGRLETQNVVFQKKTGSEQISGEDFAAAAFESFMGSQGKVTLNFSLRTRLDRPRMEHVKIKGDFFQQNILNIPDQQEIRQIGRQFEEMGQEFKKMFTPAPSGPEKGPS